MKPYLCGEEISGDNVPSCGKQLKKNGISGWVVRLVLLGVAAVGLLIGVFFTGNEAPEDPAQISDDAEAVLNARKQEALFAVLPGFDGAILSVPTTIPGDTLPVTVNVAVTKDMTLFGAAVETVTDKTFGDAFTLMVGFDNDGDILGIEVLEEEGTYGHGNSVDKDKSNCAEQFIGMNPARLDFDLKVKQEGGEVDTITGTTISSSAFCDAVNRAAKAYVGVKEIALPRVLPNLKVN